MKKNKNALPELSKPEYAVMDVLWKNGKQSVSEAHNILKESHGWALSTVRTMMDRMAKKGTVSKTNFHGIFLYAPLISKPAGLAKMVKFFAERVLNADPDSVVAMFSGSSELSPKEIEELRALLKEE